MTSSFNQFDPVISVGHPGVMTRTGPFVVTAGSFVGKAAWTDTKQYFNLPAEKGASGSGLFNLNGELVGQICCGSKGEHFKWSARQSVSRVLSFKIAFI